MAALRVYKSIDVRNTEADIIEPVKKYYFAFEGSNTEVDYFQCVKENSKELELSNMIEIIIFAKDEETVNDSAPIRVLEEAIKTKKNLIETGEFDSDIDEFVIVFDRDSFKPVDRKKEEYKRFVEVAKKDVTLAVTSPCFEIWLLLHYDTISVEFDREKISETGIETLSGIEKYREHFRQNLRVTGKHTFTSKAFSLTAGINPKSGTDFTELIKNTNKAIEREKSSIFTNNVYEMVDKIGSNIGDLIEVMRLDPRENAN